MRARAGIGLVVLVGLAAAFTPTAAQAAACQPAGTPSYRDDQVVVWTQDAPDAHVLFIGCTIATGRTFTALDFDNDCVSPSGGCDDVYPKVKRARRAGRWLALDVESQIHGRIALADVRAATIPRRDGYQEDTPREMVLRRTGTLAWITGYVPENLSGRMRALRLCDSRCRTRGKPPRSVARGRKLRHLRITRGRLFWSDGERTHSTSIR